MSPKYTSSVFGAVIAARVRVARVLEVVPHERGVARGARDASRGRREARLSIALNCAMQRRLDDGVRNPSCSQPMARFTASLCHSVTVLSLFSVRDHLSGFWHFFIARVSYDILPQIALIFTFSVDFPYYFLLTSKFLLRVGRDILPRFVCVFSFI